MSGYDFQKGHGQKTIVEAAVPAQSSARHLRYQAKSSSIRNHRRSLQAAGITPVPQSALKGIAGEVAVYEIP